MNYRDEGELIGLDDDRNDSGGQADPSVYTLAAVFGPVAFPDNMPDWLKDAILARAEQARDAAGDFVLDNRINPSDPKARRAGADDEDDNLSQFAQLALQERQQREWDQSRVEIGSVTMSGEEWDAAFQFLSNPKRRGELIDSVMKRKGWSKDRAEKAADDALTLAQLAQRRKNGTLTAADEIKADEITRRNPDAVEMVKEAAKRNTGLAYEANASGSAASQSYLADDVKTATIGYQNVVASTATSATAIPDKAFPSAPDLTTHFDATREAVIAKPDAGSPTPISPKLIAQLDISGPY